VLFIVLFAVVAISFIVAIAVVVAVLCDLKFYVIALLVVS